MRFPSLFPFSSRSASDRDSPIEYAGLTIRSFAVTLDLMLLLLLLTPLLDVMGDVLFPQFAQQGGEAVANQLLYSWLVLKQISLQEMLQQLAAMQFFARLGFSTFMQFIVGGVAIIVLWQRFDTTPGMYVLRLYVADAQTGEKPTLKQYIWRYFAGVVAVAPFMIGMLTIPFNRQKRALHDYVAGTVVLRRKYFWQFRRREASPESSEE